jgi:formylmethanofuran dehydrogenase subunit B
MEKTYPEQHRRISDVTCLFCGVTCDDLEVFVEGDTIKEVKNACILGKATFMNHKTDVATPRIKGKEASIDECIEAAADILVCANFPLIYGLASTECNAQRKAVELADLIGATIDTTSSVCHSPSLQAIQTVGDSTCTLGEIKNRAELLVFWGCNPAEAHPRHFTRYSVTPKGLFIPKGKKDRTVIVIDVRRTPSAKAADQFIQIRPGSDYEVLTVMRALLKGEELDVEEVGGIPVTVLKTLVEQLKSCRFGSIHWGMGLTMSRGKHMNVMALLLLARDLNQFTKFVASPMRGHGNVVGIATVLTWQTGYPFAVNLSRGFPQYNPGEFSSVDVLARKEADAALIVAADAIANFPKAAGEHLSRIPTIAIDAKESMTTKMATIIIPTAQAGISAPGLAYRMDHIPIPVKKVVDSPYPSDKEVLERILEKVRSKLL